MLPDSLSLTWFSKRDFGERFFYVFPVSVFGYRASQYYILFFAAATIVYGAVMLVKDGLWRSLGSRQPMNVPTAKARSAAIGLAELVGVARPVDGSDRPILKLVLGESETSPHEELVAPFYLEDASGRILIDPRGASIQPEFQPNLEAGTREIVLTRRVEPMTLTTPEVRMLLPGDPVYVIGNVQERGDVRPDAVSSERLVVKPLERKLLSRVESVLPWNSAKLDVPHVFFLSDSSERAAVTKMRRGVARIAMLASLYVASGVVLMGTSYDKAFAGYEHWTPETVYLDRPWFGAVEPTERAYILIAKLGSEDPRHRNDALRYLRLEARDLGNPYARRMDARVVFLLADDDTAVRARARQWFDDRAFRPTRITAPRSRRQRRTRIRRVVPLRCPTCTRRRCHRWIRL